MNKLWSAFILTALLGGFAIFHSSGADVYQPPALLRKGLVPSSGGGGGGGSISNGTTPNEITYWDGDSWEPVGFTHDGNLTLTLDKSGNPWTIKTNASVIPTLQDNNPFTGIQAYAASAAQTIDAVGDTVTANASTLLLSVTGGSYTLTSTNQIADAANDGADMVMCNTSASANSVTFTDQGTLANSNLRLGGITTFALAQNRCSNWRWLSSTSNWHCLDCVNVTGVTFEFIGSPNDFVTGSSTEVVALSNGTFSATTRQNVMSTTGTFTAAYIKTSTLQTAATTTTCTWEKNGSPTDIVVVISGGAGNFSDTGSSSFVPGDLYQFSCANTHTSNSANIISWAVSGTR